MKTQMIQLVTHRRHTAASLPVAARRAAQISFLKKGSLWACGPLEPRRSERRCYNPRAELPHPHIPHIRLQEPVCLRCGSRNDTRLPDHVDQ